MTTTRKALTQEDAERMLDAVHAANGWLSLARHRPGQWQYDMTHNNDIVREVEHAFTVLRNEVAPFLQGLSIDEGAAWRDLVQAAAGLGAAVAQFDNAMDAYKRAKEASESR